MSKRRDQTELLTDMATASRAAAPPVHPDLSLAECPIRADSFPHVFLMCSCSSFASTCFHTSTSISKQLDTMNLQELDPDE